MINEDDDMLDAMTRGDDAPEPTADEVIDKAFALIAEIDRLRAEYADLTPEQKAALPERTRRLLE